MEKHDSTASRSTSRKASSANAGPAAGRATTVLQSFANQAGNSPPWSGPSFSRAGKTPPGRAFFRAFAVFAAALFTAGAVLGQGADLYRKVANQLVELINAGDYAGIQNSFNKQMDAALPLDKSSAFFAGLKQQMGKIEQLGEPRSVGEAMIYPARFERGALDIQIALDSRGQIAGLLFTPRAATKPRTESNQARLSLPFKGRWLVFWGGDTRELNAHHETPNQRFAFDLLAVGEDGRTRRGDGARNEDYFAFGREVLAPADGTVVEVIEGVHDNAPGSMNPYSAVGNCVVIQHSEEEVSVLAHFKKGTIVVKTGDKVSRGQLLGLCGNSGNSSEPHVHFHLQNSPVLQDGLGIKCVFQKVDVTERGKTETRASYSPVKGDIVSPPAAR